MKEIYAALANFQQEIGTLPKDASGYGYKYTELSTIVEKALPLLKKHGLGFTQPMSGTAVKTILFHAESGESIESSLDIPQGVELKGMNEYQALGSAITYLRRYSLASILGIVTDEDTDAQGEQVKPEQNPARQATPEKEFMNQSHEKYADALQAVKDGKTNVLQIEKKYNLSPEAKKELVNIQLNPNK